MYKIIICLTFLENPEKHRKDENRTNNKLTNLEWITTKDKGQRRMRMNPII
jgi:hypothetical protein